MKYPKSRLAFFLTFMILILAFINTLDLAATPNNIHLIISSPNSPTTYTPLFPAQNIKESMTLSPMFTPDNALDIHKYWIDRANSTIEVQNQYITQFDDSKDWDNDPSPIVRALVTANTTRGVNVRVQIREDADSDDVTSYFLSKGIAVRWMGSSATASNGWLSTTHNKLVIIDDKITLLSSINFGANAFLYNREAGMVIQSPTVASYYKEIFDSDWVDGEEPTGIATSTTVKPLPKIISDSTEKISYTSPTNIPRSNFTNSYNVTMFANPDSADDVIFKYLKAAKSSIYVSMYTISRSDFNKTLIDLKKANPTMDIQVLISRRRVGASENIDTAAAAQSLVDNLIIVYNSTTDLNFYHNKYWIIDGKHTFVYSGNWSPRSVTKNDTSYSSDTNRDMGIAVHDAPDIASFFIEEVWDKDVAVASAWELPVGIKQTSFTRADVVSGTVTLSGQVRGLENATASYRWNTGDYAPVTLTNNSFSIQFETTTLNNGINTFEVKAETINTTFTDKVAINVVNTPVNENWKFLITELLPNPADVPDDEGEYIELTNSYDFQLLIENWQIGDDNLLYTFPADYTIDAKETLIIAKSETGFENAYGTDANIELDFALKNSDGDYAQLLDHHGEYIDVVAYGNAVAPDGSESVSLPDAGEAILRKELDIDTNTAADFVLGLPDPRGATPDGVEDTPLPWIPILITLVCLPFIRRRNNR